jgi:hypothetical protein
MIAQRQPLHSKYQTGKRMYQLVDKTAEDLKTIYFAGKPLCDISLFDYFRFIRTIPYRRDPRPREIIARPAHLLKYRNAGLDCKKKAILLAAYAKMNGIKYRFIASSRRPDKRIHHVYPEMEISNRMIDTDATYPENRINMKKPATKKIVLPKGSFYAI